MDKRVRERRRSIHQEHGRRRTTVAAVVVVVLVVVGLFLWMRASDVFAVKRVTTTPLKHVTAEEVYDATVDARGVSLLRLSTRAIAAELSELPYVRSAEVYRRFPDTLDVRLVEYEPVARLQAGNGEVWLVTDDGRALEKTASAALPLVVPGTAVSPVAGEKIPNAIVAGLPVASLVTSESLSETLPTLDHISVSSGGEVTVVLEDGAELRLGVPTQLEQKLTVAAAIVEQYLRDDRPLLYVDASVPDRVAVKAE
jgi:cell division protein FtsQ